MNRDFILKLRDVVQAAPLLGSRRYINRNGHCCVVGHALRLAGATDEQLSHGEIVGESYTHLQANSITAMTVVKLEQESDLDVWHWMDLQRINDYTVFAGDPGPKERVLALLDYWLTAPQ